MSTVLRFHRAANWRRLAEEIEVLPDALRPPDPTKLIQVLARYALVRDAANGDVVIHLDDDAPAGLADAITAAVNAHDATPDPPVPTPDYGTDLPANQQVVVDAIASLRQYLGLASPTLAQSAAALKLLIRVVLYLCRRAIG